MHALGMFALGGATMTDGKVLEFTGVTKTFDGIAAVSDFTARVDPGFVTAFLGPNGAGKTTTLRILLGQVRATSGRATIDGKTFAQLSGPRRHVGWVPESPTFRPRRTAAKHLAAVARQAGVASSRVGEVLSLVGLAEIADMRLSGYSLGMTQRLAVAEAMIGDPGVLVLDEPANGLDPEGIRWMRLLMRRLADEGRTVLVSSHLLSEIQQVADRLLVISNGSLVFAGGIEDLEDASSQTVAVDSLDRAGLSQALRAAGYSLELLRSGINVHGATAAEIGAVAAQAGVALTTLQQRSPSLEDVFLQLVNGEYVPPMTAALEPRREPADGAGAGDDAGAVTAADGAGAVAAAGAVAGAGAAGALASAADGADDEGDDAEAADADAADGGSTDVAGVGVEGADGEGADGGAPDIEDIEGVDVETADGGAPDVDGAEDETVTGEDADGESTDRPAADDADAGAPDVEGAEDETVTGEDADGESTGIAAVDGGTPDAEGTEDEGFTEAAGVKGTDDDAVAGEDADSETAEVAAVDGEAVDAEGADEEAAGADGETADGAAFDGDTADAEGADREAATAEDADGHAVTREAVDGEPGDVAGADGESADGEGADGEAVDAEGADAEAADIESADGAAVTAEDADGHAVTGEGADGEPGDVAGADRESGEVAAVTGEDADVETADDGFGAFAALGFDADEASTAEDESTYDETSADESTDGIASRDDVESTDEDDIESTDEDDAPHGGPADPAPADDRSADENAHDETPVGHPEIVDETGGSTQPASSDDAFAREIAEADAFAISPALDGDHGEWRREHEAPESVTAAELEGRAHEHAPHDDADTPDAIEQADEWVPFDDGERPHLPGADRLANLLSGGDEAIGGAAAFLGDPGAPTVAIPTIDSGATETVAIPLAPPQHDEDDSDVTAGEHTESVSFDELLRGEGERPEDEQR